MLPGKIMLMPCTYALYMMERFLERVSASRYRNYFILKGGILAASMVGIDKRTTMDIDTSLKGVTLSKSQCKKIVEEIADVDSGDGISFVIKDISEIMDETEYSGVRITVNAILKQIITPLKIDISTGDTITPHEVKYSYKLLLEDRTIQLYSYNLETVIAEKLQTIVARGEINTRMRDFYDLHVLFKLYGGDIDNKIVSEAFYATSRKRGSAIDFDTIDSVVSVIEDNNYMIGNCNNKLNTFGAL